MDWIYIYTYMRVAACNQDGRFAIKLRAPSSCHTCAPHTRYHNFGKLSGRFAMNLRRLLIIRARCTHVHTYAYIHTYTYTQI